MNTHWVCRMRGAGLALIILLLSAGTTHAQVVNSSFEQEGQFSASGWQTTDPACLASAEDAPPGGGAWSLKLLRRNLQGGCYGVAYQVIRQAPSGPFWNVTVWVRMPVSDDSVGAQLYWTDFAPADPTGFSPYVPRPYPDVPVAVSTSTEWTALSISIDSARVAQVDSLGIVLDAGVTSGPTSEGDFAFFDLISLTTDDSQIILNREDEQPEALLFSEASNFPNPFGATTNISFTLRQPAFVALDIFDLLGRKVYTMLAEHLTSGLHTAVWNAGDLPDGIYMARLQAGSQVRTVKLVRLR